MLCAAGIGLAAAVLASTSAKISINESPCQASPSKARLSWSVIIAISSSCINGWAIIRFSPPVARSRACDDANAGLVCGRNNLVPLEQQALSGIERETGRPGRSHCLNGLDADHWNIEAHILIRLGDLHDGKVAA